MRNLIIGIAVICLVFFLGAVVESISTDADERDRLERGAALEARAEATDQELDLYRVRAGQDSTLIRWLRDDVVRLEGERDEAVQDRRETLALRASAYAEVEVDSLPEDCLTIIGVERGVAESYHAELLVERAVNWRLDSALTLSQRLHRDAARLLLVTSFERDSAFVLLSEWESATSFSIGRLLFRDLPRKAACAGGGAAVAAVYDGDALLGAGIGLAACLVVEAIL